MAAGTEQQTQNFVTLKGSVDLIVDFFSTDQVIIRLTFENYTEFLFSRLQFE